MADHEDCVPRAEHEDGINQIINALMTSGLWQEIDGEGTEWSVIADRIVDLTLLLTEAIELLRHPNEHDIEAFLADYTPKPGEEADEPDAVPPWFCEDCGWQWPYPTGPTIGSECDSCGGWLVAKT